MMFKIAELMTPKNLNMMHFHTYIHAAKLVTYTHFFPCRLQLCDMLNNMHCTNRNLKHNSATTKFDVFLRFYSMLDTIMQTLK